VAQDVLDYRLLDEVGSLDTERLTDPVKLIQKGTTEADVDLLCLDSRLGLLCHEQHGPKSYHNATRKVVSVRYLLANTVNCRIMLCGRPLAPAWGPAETAAERMPGNGQGRCAMAADFWLSKHADLWNEVDNLYRLVKRRLPANHRVRKLFDSALCLKDDEIPNFDKLMACKVAFYNGPWRKKCLGPWKARPQSAGRLECLMGLKDSAEVYRVLFLEAYGDEEVLARDHASGVDADVMVDLNVSLAPVTVQIKEGTTRKEALEALARIVETIQGQFDALVAGKFQEEVIQQKSGTSPEPSAASLDGQSSEKASLVTAA
jgi:hypothetical protein